MKDSPLPPISAALLLREVDEALISLLRSLPLEDWERPAVGEWTVRDVAAHLLDGALRRLSVQRDGHRLAPAPRRLDDFQELVGFLNDLNTTWVNAARRLSPEVVVDLLAWVNPQVSEVLESLDPEGEAAFPVAWAGEAASKAWMDVAREFTERWHHQQQIREAVGAPWLDEPRFIEPLLNCLIRALPRAYAGVRAPQGTSLLVEISDREGLSWVLYRRQDEWRLARPFDALEPTAAIRLPAETAWRLFFKNIDGVTAMESARIEGDSSLAEPFFSTVAVMA